MRGIRSLVFVLFIAAFLAGGWLSFAGERPDPASQDKDARLPTFTFYTAQTATTPQLAFWKAVRDGDTARLFNLNVEFWKDLDSLKTLLLAGRGDLWLGHLEGFARAKKNGAPLSLLAVTGWKKFYLLSTNPDLSALKDYRGRTLAYCPPGSPAVPVIKALLGTEASSVTFVPQGLAEAAQHLSDKTYDSVIVPEPLATALLHKVNDLRVVLNLEEAYGTATGHPHRLPLAGIAVNSETAAKHPRAIAALLSLLEAKGAEAARNPIQALANLPESVTQSLGQDIAAESLSRDLILVEPAAAVEQEIADYLKMVEPDLVSTEGRLALPSSFIWHAAERDSSL